MFGVRTIDTHYAGQDQVAAAYLLVDEGEAAFVETNTSSSVPGLLAALAAEGLSPERVKYVIITHIHLDHAGGAGVLMAACPNATLLAHPKAAPHAIDPSRIVKGATAVYGEEAFAELYGEVRPTPAERVRAMADGETVELGGRTLTFLHTRGHANHHFCVHDSRSEGVFTGDSMGVVYPHLQDKGVFALASTSPTDFDEAAAHEALDRIVATGAKRVYPTHFGEYTEVQAIADQLHAQLTEYGQVVEAALADGLEGDLLATFCSERARQIIEAHLREHGHGPEDARTGIVATDVDLNGQGLAFAVQKIRYKRGK